MAGPATPPPLSLYVHVPWCVRKCPYCDFNSHGLRGEELPEAAYVDALLADLEHELPGVWGRTVQTVFIGGGTPSLLSPAAVDRLLAGIRARVALRPDAEVTLEANPGTVEQGRFAELRAAGVNRLSIGVQSFDADMLRRLGRIHGPAEARRAAESAHAAGFERFNLDLMYGLPAQTPEQAAADLAAAIALAPPHLSWYQLTLEPNTAFHHDPPPLPGEDAVAAMAEAGAETLAAAGYTRYEVSAHARPGQRCAHNLNYWRFGDYLGIGAGAHGKRSDAAGVHRRWKQRHPAAYLDAAGAGAVAGERTLDAGDLAFEYMLNALRLEEGFTADAFETATGLPWARVEATVAAAAARGLMQAAGARWRPSPLGRRFLNDVMALFLPEAADGAGGD